MKKVPVKQNFQEIFGISGTFFYTFNGSTMIINHSS